MVLRDTKTNKMLEVVANCINKHNDQMLDITINVDGQVITGTVIDEETFFKIDQNSSLSKIYHEHKKVRDYIFNAGTRDLKEDLTSEVIDEIPDHYFQHILYLKDAHFVMSNGVMLPTNGTSMQVRIADISCFAVGRFQPIEQG